MILSLTSVPMETSQTKNGLIQVLFSVTLTKEIVQTFFPKFPQQKLNNIKLEIVFTGAAPAFDNLFMGCVFNINTVHKTVEKLTFQAFYWSKFVKEGVITSAESISAITVEKYHSRIKTSE